MRKFLAGVLGLSLAAMLIYGAIGSGAVFQFTGTAQQQIAVGTFGFKLSTDTGTVNTAGDAVTCTIVNVSTSIGTDPGCNVTVTRTGTIVPLNFSVLMSSTTTGAQLNKFAVTEAGLIPSTTAHKELSTSLTPLGYLLSPPAVFTVSLPLDWGYNTGGDLTNTDMGQSITITYQFNSAQ